MRIRITQANSIFGNNGALAVGHEMTVSEVPVSWAGRYEVIGEPSPSEEIITGLDRDALKAEAEALGIEYARNVTNEKLKELIDAKKAEAPGE